MLDDVIVTALGIEKKASSLSYSAMQLKSDELNRVKETNMITALAGKAAGMQVSKNSSGPGLRLRSVFVASVRWSVIISHCM